MPLLNIADQFSSLPARSPVVHANFEIPGYARAEVFYLNQGACYKQVVDKKIHFSVDVETLKPKAGR
jgi:hypothetical protein